MATYYIDYKNGNDGNTGGSGDPWKTLFKFLAACANNDACKVRGTDTDDEIYFERGLATVKTGLTIEPDTGHSPVFSSALSYTAWVPTGGTANVYETAYVAANCYAVWNDTTLLTLVANVAACDATPDSYYFDNPGNLLHVNIGGVAPTFITACDSAAILFTANGANLSWEGCNLRWFMRGVDLRAAGCSISNCSMTQYFAVSNVYFGVGLDATATADTVTIVSDATDVGSGIYIYGTSTGATIIGCSLSGYMHYGISIEAAATGLIITLTSITGQMYDCISIVGGITATISYCILTDGRHTCIVAGSGASTITIHHNLLYFTSAITYQGHHGIVMHCNGTVNLYHNDILWLARGATPGGGKEAYYVSPIAGFLTINARNNCAYECLTGWHYSAAGGTPIYNLDYTGFFQCTNNYMNIGAGDQGVNDLAADPLFTNAAGNDFTLQSASPYRGAGEYIAGVSEYNPATIGRYEYNRTPGILGGGIRAAILSN